MNGYQTKTVTIGALIAAAIVVLGYFVGAAPRLENAEKYKTEAEAATNAADQVRANIGQLKQKEADLPTATREYTELARQFPAEFGASEWSRMIATAARNAGVELDAVTPSIPQVGTTATAPDPSTGAVAAPVDGNIATSNVSITATGSTAQVRDFVQRLSRLPRPILVSALSITETEGGSQVAITGSTFLMRELPDPSRTTPDTPETPATPAPNRPGQSGPEAPAMPEIP